MKIRLIIFTLILLKVEVNAQNLHWAINIPDNFPGHCDAVATDDSGNVYSTGDFAGIADFDPGPSTFNLNTMGTINVFISKLDAAGNFIWAKQLAGTSIQRSYAIKIDNLGNVYTTGFFQGTTDFDPGPGVFNLTSVSGTEDIFISKLDAAGNFIWAKQIESTGSSEKGNSLAIGDDGAIYITGEFQETADFDPGVGVYLLTSSGTNLDIYILNLDSNGNFMWAKRMGGSGADVGRAIDLDSYGNIYTTGYFQNTVDFDPGVGVFNLGASGNRDVFISKLDSVGNFVWANRIGGGGSEEGYSLAIDRSSNICMTGYFSSTCDFDPGPATFNLSSASSNDIFVTKLSSAGNFIWANRMGGSDSDVGRSLVVDSSNNVYSTGWFGNTVDFDPGTATYNFASYGLYDVFVSKLDSLGNFAWADRVGGANYDYSHGIAIDKNENIVFGGYFLGTADFDPGAGVFNLVSVGGDPYVAKFCQHPPLPLGIIQGYDTVCSGSSHIFNIPLSNEALSYTWTLPIGWTGSSSTNSINITADTTSGSITVVGNNACGSSIASVFLVTVNNISSLPIVNFLGPSAICDGTSTLLLTNHPNGNIWSDGTTNDSLLVSVPGIYTVTYTENGCSATTTPILINAGTSSNSVINPVVCSNYLSPSGMVYTTDGIYSDTITNYLGCDSVITINLTVNSHSSSTISPVVCDFFSSPAGNYYISSGTFTDIIPNYLGCDSIITINLTVNAPSLSSINPVVCETYPSPAGNNYTSTGIYADTIPNHTGCDSIISINLTVNNTSMSTMMVAACDSYLSPSGNVYSGSNVYSDTIPNFSGCDSIITIALTINTANSNVTQAGAQLSAVSSPGTYQWFNCDSNTPVSGATSQIFTATTNGNYALIITNNGCTDTSSCFTVSGLSIDDLSLNIGSVYPNPVKENCTVQLNSLYENIRMVLTDNTGRVILQKNYMDVSKLDVNIENLSPGVYIVSLYLPAGEQQSIKIIKQ